MKPVTVPAGERISTRAQRVDRFRAALKQQCALKVIAGINNFQTDHVLAVVEAASRASQTQGAASNAPTIAAVDIAAASELLTAVRQATDLPVFVSSVNPADFKDAVSHGADGVELGNYDALYDEGLFLTAENVLRLTRETLDCVPADMLVSVTLPGYLSTDVQVRLAQALEALQRVDVLQTEGACQWLAAEKRVQSLPADQKAAKTLQNTRILAQNTTIPIMTASGMAVDCFAKAFKLGASAVGIGSAVNKLATTAEMQAVLMAMLSQRLKPVRESVAS